jgi:hypothetical protein
LAQNHCRKPDVISGRPGVGAKIIDDPANELGAIALLEAVTSRARLHAAEIEQ